MDFAFDERTEQLRSELLDFMDACVYAAEPEFERTDPEAPFSWERPKIMAELRAEARSRGLWNLFLPDPERGAGLSNLQYAPLAEITGRSPHVAPEALNAPRPTPATCSCCTCSAPPSNNSAGSIRCWTRRSGRRSA
jgi:acyl-CoA dehydrogenase